MSWRVIFLLSCRNGWMPQTAMQNCDPTCETWCQGPTTWTRCLIRRKRSGCRNASSTHWSVSCLARIRRRAWPNSSRAASPLGYVAVSSRRERQSTPAGQRSPKAAATYIFIFINLSIHRFLSSCVVHSYQNDRYSGSLRSWTFLSKTDVIEL